MGSKEKVGRSWAARTGAGLTRFCLDRKEISLFPEEKWGREGNSGVLGEGKEAGWGEGTPRARRGGALGAPRASDPWRGPLSRGAQSRGGCSQGWRILGCGGSGRKWVMMVPAPEPDATRALRTQWASAPPY